MFAFVLKADMQHLPGTPCTSQAQPIAVVATYPLLEAKTDSTLLANRLKLVVVAHGYSHKVDVPNFHLHPSEKSLSLFGMAVVPYSQRG
jgi:hypothetical protein